MKKVPELRFKEFTDEWEEKKLGEITEIKGGYAFKSSKFLNKISKYQVVKMGNLYQNKLLLDRNPSFIAKIFDKEEQYLLKKNDIILTLTGTVGKRDFGYSYKIKNEKNLLLNQRLACIRVKSMEYNTDFIKEIIRNEKFLNDFFELSIGGTGNQANVSIKDIENIEIIIPLYKEQQKIADFLSAVDEKIEKSEKKVELLKDYKKGMMQKIFAQEIRFKDENGNDYPAWEEKKLGEIGKFYRGHSYNSTNVVEQGILVLRSNNIQNNKISYNDLQFVDKECKQEIMLKDKDIVICMANGSKKLVGKSGEYQVNDKFEKVTVGAFCSIFRSKNILSKYLFQTQKYFNEISLLLEGTNINNLKNLLLEEINFYIPKLLEEQQKIADFLSAIDEKIEKEEKKVEELKELKKGLLQKMFV